MSGSPISCEAIVVSLGDGEAEGVADLVAVGVMGVGMGLVLREVAEAVETGGTVEVSGEIREGAGVCPTASLSCVPCSPTALPAVTMEDIEMSSVAIQLRILGLADLIPNPPSADRAPPWMHTIQQKHLPRRAHFCPRPSPGVGSANPSWTVRRKIVWICR